MKKGFTLAEVLITLAIIGVVAAVSIPSVISNSTQQQYRTGLRKAISVLNSAITMNMALEGESPYDNQDLFRYFQRHMSVMHSEKNLRDRFYTYDSRGGIKALANSVFYTTDGMRFEFRLGGTQTPAPLYENRSINVCTKGMNIDFAAEGMCGGCGSYGLNNNIDGTTKPPCLIIVDVNGDRKPNPDNVNCHSQACAEQNKLKLADPAGLRLTDIFTIMITDKQAIPYGTAAQKAMYQAQKK